MTQQTKRENFTQLPNVLFDQCSDLDGLERWLCACLARLCWIPEKKYQISLRLLEKVSGISAGSLCSCGGKTPHEGMLFKLHRLGYIILERKDEKKNAPYIIQLTNRLWEENTPQSVFSINAHADAIVYSAKSVFVENASVSQENTSVFVENASVSQENTKGVLKSSQKLVEEPPNTSNTSNTKEERGEENIPLEIPSTEKTDETPDSQNPFHVPTPEKKTPPAWREHLPKVRSTQYKMPDKLFVQPKEGQVPEPRPLTKNEQRKVDEAEVEDTWSLAEEVLQTTYPYGVRTTLANSRGLLGIIGERCYSRADIKLGLERLDDFQIRTFTWEKFHLWLPGLLSGKYKQQQKSAAHSSRPLDIAPQPGGWGRRLDGAMMPGAGRVRHD